MTNFLNKINNKLKSTIIKLGFKSSLFFDQPWLAALIFYFSAREINKKGNKKYRVLCLRRSIFLEDVKTMSEFSGLIDYVIVESEYFRLLLNYFLKENQVNVTEENYHSTSVGQFGKQKYYDFLNEMFPLLRRLLKFDAILSGNFGYMEQQEIARVCKERKVPFIILHKEGVAIPGTYQKWATLCKGYKFIGDKLLLYNEDIKKALLAIEFSGLTEEKVKVVGVPRLDKLFRKERKKTDDKQIVFFSFYPSDKLFFFIGDDAEKINKAEKRVEDFHRWIINFAAQNPSYKIIIKTKFSKHYLEFVLNIFKVKTKEKINNLVITNLGDTADLIQDSSAVIGFNSTTFIESIILDKPIASPYFGDLTQNEPWDWFGEYPGLASYIKKESDILSFMEKLKGWEGYDYQIKRNFLDIFVNNCNGKSSIRAERAVIETINSLR